MDVNVFLQKLDDMFETKQFAAVDEFLTNAYIEAKEEGDTNAVITVLNEMAGYYRESTRYEEAVECATESREIMDELGMQGTAQYAAMLLNQANAYRAAGIHDKALMCYDEVKFIYDNNIDAEAYMYAALYNNISILYQAMEDYDNAAECLLHALEIISRLDDTQTETAVTYTNLAATYVKGGRLEDALVNAKKAQYIFEQSEDRDYHYSACVNALGEISYMMGDYTAAVDFYNIALKEIMSTIGCENETYKMILDNRNNAAKMAETIDDVNKCVNISESKNSQENNKINEDKKIQGCSNLKECVKLQGCSNLSKDDSVNESECSVQNHKVVQDVNSAQDTQITQPSVIEICKEYYELYGKPMLENKFKDYVNQIAVGLCGEGSECFGFEDEYSKDHDCGPGFCMWMTQELFDKIGGQLNEEYAKLPQEFKGLRNTSTQEGKWRRGAMSIEFFYKTLLGIPGCPETEEEWSSIDEWRIAAATNGIVFCDPLQEFSKIRIKLLAYYPNGLWRKMLAEKLAKSAQSGQYNYGRMMARGEFVAARIAFAHYIEEVIQIVYLVNRKYCPYYKWMHRGIRQMRYLPEMYDLINEIVGIPDQREAWKNYTYNGKINYDDKVVVLMETIGNKIANKLNEIGLTTSNDPFLQVQAHEVLKGLGINKEVKQKHQNDEKSDTNYMLNKENDIENNKSVSDNTMKNKKTLSEQTNEELIDDIVQLEWISFDKVHNEGGRADCQDDWKTFSIMRKSQYMTWTRQMLMSFILDIAEANETGRNLIEEKYGRMMESTAPQKYDEIKDSFPKLPDRRVAIQEQVIKIQVQWMEEFAAHYEYMAGNARSIHTSEDNMFNTSYETYLRGELSTYSEETLKLYAQFIVDLCKNGDNLAKMIMENTAKQYGFESLDQAESYCRK